MARSRAFASCFHCQGKSGQPRASLNAIRCGTASACKTALTRKRKQELKEQTSTAGMGDPGLADTEKMPDGMWVHELTEILGERCCQVGKLSKKRRRSGPCGTSYEQEFLARGLFLEEDADDEEAEDEDVAEPNTYWVTRADLLETIDVADVKTALKERQERALEELA